MHLPCGYSHCESGSFEVLSLQHGAYAHEDQNVELHFARTFSFMWRSVPFENCTLRFGVKNFVLFREIDLDFGGSMSWNA